MLSGKTEAVIANAEVTAAADPTASIILIRNDKTKNQILVCTKTSNLK